MFSRAVRIFSLQGFDVKLDPSWLIIAALITWSLATQLFPQLSPDLHVSTYYTMAVIAMLAFFASLILHELAHSIVARSQGVEIKGITLFIFGGVAELGSEPPTAKSEFWIAIAGPIMSFALAAGFGFLSLIGRISDGLGPVVSVLSYLSIMNLILAAFNLLPAFPLDGGRVFRAYLWAKTGDLLAATRRATRIGVVFAYALMALGLMSLFHGNTTGGLWQIFIGVFLLFAARNTYQHQLVKTSLGKKTVAQMMTRDAIITDPEQTLSALVNQILLPHRKSFVPVVEEGVLLGAIDTSVLSGIDRDNWSTTQVGDVFYQIDAANTVEPTAEADVVLARMAASRRTKLMVADGRKLLGVVTLSDLLGYLAVLQDLQIVDERHGKSIAH